MAIFFECADGLGFSTFLSNILYNYCIEKRDNIVFSLVFRLALIGLSVFELLFEARAWYLYIYVPLYIIVAVWGLREPDVFTGKRSG